MAEKKHIQHLRSKVVENGKPKLPAVGTLAVGEIAVNYANGYETLSIENDASGITTFSSDDVYTKNKLGGLFSGDTTVTDVIKHNELIIASALIDLNEKKQDTLVSGTNIKTINNTSLLGEGNITISGGGSVTIDSALSDTSENPVQNKVITSALAFKKVTNPTATTNVGLVNSLSEHYDTNIGKGAVIEGNGDEDYIIQAIGNNSHAEGFGTTASGSSSHAEGNNTAANGNHSHAEGSDTIANGYASHAEGQETTARGSSSHAEGFNTTASGSSSHAEGEETTAIASNSHAEGFNTTASGSSSHAEGEDTTANGYASHAEGSTTTARGSSSHAEGEETYANGNHSHAEGQYTVANNQSEHASGQYNVSSSASTTFGDSGNTLFSVGNGSDEDYRHNAFEIRQNGDIYIVKDNNDVKLQNVLNDLDDKADSINIADYFPNGAKSGETMPRRAVYHYNGNILHSRYILIDEVDTGGTEGNEEECLIFCYHSDMLADVHGTYYYAFYSYNPNYYRYCYTWTYANAPKYIKQAFGEYTESDTTQVLTFNNPIDDTFTTKEEEVYKRVVERLSETPGEVVPVVWHDYSDGFEIFGDGDGGWLQGCAYQRGTNKVVVDLYGVGYTDEVRAFVSLSITKTGDNTYSYTMYFKDLDATATSGTSGLMSAEDKIALDSLSSAVTQVNNALTAHTADTDVHVTSNEKTTWNNKSDFSGNYNDLTNKPTIPSYTAGSGITISNDTISAKIWSGTKAAYEALTTKDSDTIYLIYNE